jgi:hypothetical protein
MVLPRKDVARPKASKRSVPSKRAQLTAVLSKLGDQTLAEKLASDIAVAMLSLARGHVRAKTI